VLPALSVQVRLLTGPNLRCSVWLRRYMYRCPTAHQFRLSSPSLRIVTAVDVCCRKALAENRRRCLVDLNCLRFGCFNITRIVNRAVVDGCQPSVLIVKAQYRYSRLYRQNHTLYYLSLILYFIRCRKGHLYIRDVPAIVAGGP